MRLSIRCEGYFDEPLSSSSQIEELMSGIEAGSIERPEFEIVDNDSNLSVHVGALYLEGSGSCRPIGWLVSKLDCSDPRNYAVCDSSTPDDPVKGLIFCGVPETINRSAIIDREMVIEAVLIITEGGAKRSQYSLRPFREVFG
jgi:hypothetical protein